MNRREALGRLAVAPAALLAAVKAMEATSFERVGNLLVWTHRQGRFLTTETSRRLAADTVQMSRVVTERVAFFWSRTVEKVTWTVRGGETVGGSTHYDVMPPRGLQLPASSLPVRGK